MHAGELNITQTNNAAFNAFKTYVQAQGALLNNANNNNNPDPLSFALIPYEFRQSDPDNTFKAAANKLTDRLDYFEALPTPSEWLSYGELQSDGSDTMTVQTAFNTYPNFSEVIGLMWKVLCHDAFIRQTLPNGAEDMRVQSQLTHIQQSFVQALLLADDCAKGRTSKIFHRVLEGVSHRDFTSRAQLIHEFEQKKREFRNTEMLKSDVLALQHPITEDLLRQAHFAKEQYPKQFEDVVKYLTNVEFLSLIDNNDDDNREYYEQHFGVRQYIFGHAKRYLYNHFPTGYKRTKPIEGDYRLLEENYVPELFYNRLNQFLNNAIDRKEPELDALVQRVHQAIQFKQSLPEMPAGLASNLPEGWGDDYQSQRAHLSSAVNGSEEETEFQHVILQLATRSSYTRMLQNQNIVKSEFNISDMMKAPANHVIQYQNNQKRTSDNATLDANLDLDEGVFPGNSNIDDEDASKREVKKMKFTSY